MMTVICINGTVFLMEYSNLGYSIILIVYGLPLALVSLLGLSYALARRDRKRKDLSPLTVIILIVTGAIFLLFLRIFLNI